MEVIFLGIESSSVNKKHAETTTITLIIPGQDMDKSEGAKDDCTSCAEVLGRNVSNNQLFQETNKKQDIPKQTGWADNRTTKHGNEETA